MRDMTHAAVKERPILFNKPMVRAVLDGRKTQTRRIVNLQTGDTFDEKALVGAIQEWRPVIDGGRVVGKRAAVLHCPYGLPGDRLWVREAWRTLERPSDAVDGVVFAADDVFVPIENTLDAANRWVTAHNNGSHVDRWRPSIHMPRWASRITLEVTAVRVERLQDISEADVRAEGLASWTKDGTVHKWGLAERHVSGELDAVTPWADMERSARGAFQRLWDSINAKRAPWESNPLVWVVEFKVVQP